MLLWHRKTVFLEGEDVALDRLADVRDGSLAGLPLRNAPWKAWALRHPKAIFTGINDCLTHKQ